MAFLIDGSNLIGHTSPYDLRDPRGKYNLVGRLIAFQRINRTKILLVFDGPPDTELENIHTHFKKIKIFFPPPGQKADHIIKDILSKWKNKRRFFIVSSDRELKDFARTLGFKVLTCQEFNKELKNTLKEYKKIQELLKEDTLLSPLEIDLWGDIFKSDHE